MAKLTYTLQSAPGETHVLFEGVLDEATDLRGLLDELGEGTVVLDLRGITRVNSLGLKHWLQAVRTLTARQKVAIAACSSPMVLQANMVKDIFAGAEVRSCETPYFCARCQQSHTLLVTAAEVLASPAPAPPKLCPACHEPMELDELESFFGFMR